MDKERAEYKILSETGDKVSKEPNPCTNDSQTGPRILRYGIF